MLAVVHHAWTDDWYKWGFPALLALFGVIAIGWRFIGSAARIAGTAARVDSALPTLLSIADQFKANGGSSLKDQLDAIQEEGRERARLLEEQARILQEHTHQDEGRFATLEGILLAQGITNPPQRRRAAPAQKAAAKKAK